MCVEIQRGFDSSVSQLLLSDLSGNADVVQDRCVYVTQLMPRHALEPCRFCSRPQDALQKIAFAVRTAQLVGEE
jgi:hypothetical protein